ncbi:MAG: hypothetical protein UU56_C0001G0043 [Candidatus Curtissbacteria bacterium GW2011_GWA2_41_24]|uniref:Uncharacterized protein n=1 Tax=Candidatus Curtissbacteria bacterium GW2011_GWA2_41_24 TaxID=1618411 RepID=A0A0G0Y6J6_9BACT|nr:MAG: hypothetical protein UU56_C0001G0043 [Candidatus Curtissbacteria bacterium GW2011_GWA2_41_24]
MKFSEELVNEAEQYLTKKTGEKPDKGLTEEFLMAIAELGKLLANYADGIQKES